MKNDKDSLPSLNSEICSTMDTPHLLVRISAKKPPLEPSESRILTMFETDLTEALQKVCKIQFIRRTTQKTSRDILFNVAHPERVEVVLRQLMYFRKPLREFSYEFIKMGEN